MSAWLDAVKEAFAKLRKTNPKATLSDAMKEAKKTYAPPTPKAKKEEKKWRFRIRHTGSKYWGGDDEEEEVRIVFPVKIPKARLLHKSVKVTARQ